MSIKFRVLEGSIWGGAGGSADSIFMGARIFLRFRYSLVLVLFSVLLSLRKSSVFCENLGPPPKQKIDVNKFWARESEIEEE